jgi:hypothetical protein
MRTTIYHDPVTRQLPEGDAEVVQAIRTLPGDYDGGRLRLFKVRFAGTDRIRQRVIWQRHETAPTSFTLMDSDALLRAHVRQLRGAVVEIERLDPARGGPTAFQHERTLLSRRLAALEAVLEEGAQAPGLALPGLDEPVEEASRG